MKRIKKTVADTLTIDDTAYYDAVCPLTGPYTGSDQASPGGSANIG